MYSFMPNNNNNNNNNNNSGSVDALLLFIYVTNSWGVVDF
jgi:hypothetical protein